MLCCLYSVHDVEVFTCGKFYFYCVISVFMLKRQTLNGKKIVCYETVMCRDRDFFSGATIILMK